MIAQSVKALLSLGDKLLGRARTDRSCASCRAHPSTSLAGSEMTPDGAFAKK
jgi:hypothetical protein